MVLRTTLEQHHIIKGGGGELASDEQTFFQVLASQGLE